MYQLFKKLLILLIGVIILLGLLLGMAYSRRDVDDILEKTEKPRTTNLASNRSIWVLDSNSDLFEVNTEFLFSNSRLAIYIQSGHSANVSYLEEIVDQTMIYIEKIHVTFGEQILDMDTNDIVFVDFVNLPDITTAGYFFPPNQYTTVDNPESYRFRSCECEQLYINLRIVNLVSDITLQSKILHEYTNLFQFTFDRIEDLWISEGLSTWLEWWSGAADQNEMKVYQQPIASVLDGSLSLSYFSSKLEEFGITSRFMDYLYNIYGISSMVDFLHSDSFSFWGIEEVFGIPFRNLFADWLIAEFSQADSTMSIASGSRLPVSGLKIDDSISNAINLVPNGWKAFSLKSLSLGGQGFVTVNITPKMAEETSGIFEIILLGQLKNDSWRSAFVTSQKAEFIFRIPRLNDFSQLIMILISTSFDSSGINNYIGGIDSSFTGYFLISHDQEYDFNFLVPTNVSRSLNLSAISFPVNLSDAYLNEGRFKLLIQVDGLWIELESHLFSSDTILIFGQSGIYLIEVFLDDNTTGISNSFTVVVENEITEASGFSAFFLVIVFLFLTNFKSRRYS